MAREGNEYRMKIEMPFELFAYLKGGGGKEEESGG